MANPIVISALTKLAGDLMKHAFTKKNIKSKTTVAATTIASATAASAQTNLSPGVQAFPGDPEKAVILDGLFYLVSLILFFWKGRE